MQKGLEIVGGWEREEGEGVGGSSKRYESKLEFPGEGGGVSCMKVIGKNHFCREGTVCGFFLKLHVQAIIHRKKNHTCNFYI